MKKTKIVAIGLLFTLGYAKELNSMSDLLRDSFQNKKVYDGIAGVVIEANRENNLEMKIDESLHREAVTSKVDTTDIRKRTSRYSGLVEKASEEHKVAEDLIYALIYVESRGNPRARSHKGAKGLMQLMPLTAKEVGVNNVYDPSQSINGGTKYLSDLMERYKRNEILALAAYNMGPTKVDRLLKRKNLNPGEVKWYDLKRYFNKETRNYVPRIVASKYAISSIK